MINCYLHTQLLAVQQIGASYICPDNFLCVLNLHVVYQFRMLQNTLVNLWSNIDERTDIVEYSNECYVMLKKCIRKHQSLIEFSAKLDDIYTLPILSHMVIFSVLMCFDTYEVILADVSPGTRLIFFFHMIGSFTHIIFFTYICNGLVEESTNISTASYSGWWMILPMTETGRKIRKDTRIMIMKSMRPCYLSAGGFFPVTLETSTAVCSNFFLLIPFTLKIPHLAIRYDIFLMKIVGLWLAANRNEQRRRDFALIYTVGALFISICIAIRDIYHTWGNFSKNFWRPYYDPQEILIVADCKRICNIFIILMIFCTQGTCAGYMVTPLIANIGRNESDRILPFNLWVDFPVGTSPYFEILFTIQILCVYHVGVCYICFDNLLCIVNLHVASQFRILQHRLRSIDNATENQIEEYESDARLSYYTNMCCTKLRNCVQQHQMLIEYCKKLENIFTLIVLAQVDTPTSKKASLVLNLCGVLCQLLMFTYSCDDLMRQSVNVGNASFSGPWPILPMNEAGATVRKDLLIIIMRSHKICCITAGKFFPVSLQTFTGVLSTAMSYFTLLRNTSLDATNS
ncbi:uncharacterized protein LOC112212658 [Bombus impatiens]|uniref:Uncharacterized protein LOC112212658 n=1 Tax=Bombus impatiens TaxID=132113 RepID=A0A6P8LCY5_BOMIM|nr:uncharacterized protein LOC112212658 [Bombus impatiens]